MGVFWDPIDVENPEEAKKIGKILRDYKWPNRILSKQKLRHKNDVIEGYRNRSITIEDGRTSLLNQTIADRHPERIYAAALGSLTVAGLVYIGLNELGADPKHIYELAETYGISHAIIGQEIKDAGISLLAGAVSYPVLKKLAKFVY